MLCRQPQSDDEAAAVWQSTCKFSGLTYWNHDAYPAAMDGMPRVLEWLAASKAVRLALCMNLHGLSWEWCHSMLVERVT